MLGKSMEDHTGFFGKHQNALIFVVGLQETIFVLGGFLEHQLGLSLLKPNVANSGFSDVGY
jgi:hypothetical protein